MNKPALALKRILLVDPDLRTREKSALRLALLDMEVLKASSPAEAVALLESGDPHLVVTDWPLSGGEAESLFHGKLKSGLVPVIFCGSKGIEEIPAPSRAAHVFVSKQDRQELLNQVNRLLAEKTIPTLGMEEGRRPTKAPRHILIIEDSLTLRGIIRRALEKAFPADVVREAPEGRQALSEMSQQKVDLIVTDLEMPGMDGFTFLNHLKGNQLLSRKPVLIFSSKISEDLRERAAQMPNVRFLHKPATPEKIVAEVLALLET